jgi:hypothetical protein
MVYIGLTKASHRLASGMCKNFYLQYVLQCTNPDSRPLPAGWAEHFDSQCVLNPRFWVARVTTGERSSFASTNMHDGYYVDLNSEPPSRVAFVHPCDGITQPLSVPSLGMGPQRPIEPREGTNRSRRATVAQQLYASSM